MKPFTFLALILLSAAIFTAPISAQNANEAQTPSAPQTPFADVPPNHWAAPAVKRLAELGIIEGFPGEVPTTAPAMKSKPMARAKATKATSKKAAVKRGATIKSTKR